MATWSGTPRGVELAMVGKKEFYVAMRATTGRVFIGVSSLTSANPFLAPAQNTVATQEHQVALAVG